MGLGGVSGDYWMFWEFQSVLKGSLNVSRDFKGYREPDIRVF